MSNSVKVSLAPDSPSGEIAPGDNRLLAVFTFNSAEPNQLYGFELDIADNYNNPDYYFVDQVWVADEAGNMVFPAQSFYYEYDGFKFWGIVDLPAGETRLKVMGHVSFGEQPDGNWDPHPEFQVKVLGIYASDEVDYPTDLSGNTLYPRYTGTNYVRTSLANDSMEGTFFAGFTYEVYKFNIWASAGDFVLSNLDFEVTNFDGDFQGCAVYEGTTLISDQTSYYTWTNTYIVFDESADSQNLLITTTPRTFSLWCQVETNSDQQTVNVQFGGGHFQPGPSGMYIMINNGPWSRDITFNKADELAVSLASDTPSLITPGVDVPVMKINMVTSAGDAKLYSLPFYFYNDPAGSYSNCHIEDENRQTVNKGISGHDLGDNNIYMIFFFGPSDGIYPGDSYDFTVVTSSPRTFILACDVAYVPELTTSIQVDNVYYYQVGGDYFKILPDDGPMPYTLITQP